MIPLHDDNPTKIIPIFTWAFMAVCILVFLWQLSLGRYGQNAMLSLGMIPASLFDIHPLPADLAVIPPWATLITSMFMHGGWMHLIGNMLYLFIFGNNIEDAMGHTKFIVFYLICGVAAALAQAIPNPASTIPMIGASGAISGVLGAYLMLYPHARVLVAIPLGFIIHTTRIKAYWVLGFWFVMQLVSTMLSGDQQGGVAFGAHIGGFIAGMALVPFFKHSKVRLFAPGRRY